MAFIISAPKPEAPTFLSATSDLGGISIRTNRLDASLPGIEVWVATSNDREQAELFKTISEGIVFHALPTDSERWYWARTIGSVSGVYSEWTPVSADSGVYAKSLQAGTSDIVPNAISDFTVEQTVEWNWSDFFPTYVTAAPSGFSVNSYTIPISGKGQWMIASSTIDFAVDFGFFGSSFDWSFGTNIRLYDVTGSARTLVSQGFSYAVDIDWSSFFQNTSNNNYQQLVAFLSADKNFSIELWYGVENPNDDDFDITFRQETFMIQEVKR